MDTSIVSSRSRATSGSPDGRIARGWPVCLRRAMRSLAKSVRRGVEGRRDHRRRSACRALRDRRVRHSPYARQRAWIQRREEAPQRDARRRERSRRALDEDRYRRSASQRSRRRGDSNWPGGWRPARRQPCRTICPRARVSRETRAAVFIRALLSVSSRLSGFRPVGEAVGFPMPLWCRGWRGSGHSAE